MADFSGTLAQNGLTLVNKTNNITSLIVLMKCPHVKHFQPLFATLCL